MLTKLKVRGFRLLHDVSLEFSPGNPMVVIGPNSSGKSSLIEVLDFLATAVSEGLEQAGFRDRQGPTDFITAGDGRDLEIEITLSALEGFPNEPDGGPVSYHCVIAADGGYLRVVSERIEVYKRGTDQQPLRVLDRSGSSCWLHNLESREQDKITVKTHELALAKIEQEGRYPTLSNVRKALKTVSTYPGFLATPSWARDPREGVISPRESTQLIPVERLDRRGLDLINALYSLHSFHSQCWDELVHHFTQEFPFVERLTFPPDPGGSRLALGWSDKRYPGVPMRAQQMSSGMVHFLSLLTAALTPDKPMLLAFDEPEAHLHPSAVRRWVHILETVSEETAVLVVTHSSQLLEFLDDPTHSVVTCEVGPNGVELEALDGEALAAWLEEYSMAELRRRGFLDASNDCVPELA
jgi:predicted ATPase